MRLALLAAAATLTLGLGAQAQPAGREADRASAEADRLGPVGAGPADWLAQAQAALRRGRPLDAQELIERAETRVLTRSTDPTQADEPMRAPFLADLSAAKAAIARRDTPAAQRLIAAAIGRLDGMPQPVATTPDRGPGIDPDPDPSPYAGTSAPWVMPGVRPAVRPR